MKKLPKKSLGKSRNTSSKNSGKISFQGHLLEIRTRLLWCLLTIGIGTTVGYYLYPQILSVLIKPSLGPLFYTSPAGGFDFTIKISLFFGLLCAIPVVIYHIIRFIEPVFPAKSLLSVGKFFLLSIILMLCGMSFAYFICLPASFNFFNQFSSNQIQSLISTDAYFSFVTRYILGFGILFELPLVLLLINSFTPLSLKLLFSYQKFVILLSFILAGIITPTPDFLNQSFIALPIISLYQLSVVVIYLVNKK